MDNENIKKAAEKLEDLNNDEVARALAEYYADAKRNEISALQGARDEGLSQGLSQGISQGISQGKIEGARTKKIEIIQRMLAKNIDIETISELTDTSIKEILSIKNKSKI